MLLKENLLQELEEMAAAKQHVGALEAAGNLLVVLLSGGEGSEAGTPLVYSKRNIKVCKVMQLLQWQYFETVIWQGT